jgi:hypothetical protein
MSSKLVLVSVLVVLTLATLIRDRGRSRASAVAAAAGALALLSTVGSGPPFTALAVAGLLLYGCSLYLRAMI